MKIDRSYSAFHSAPGCWGQTAALGAMAARSHGGLATRAAAAAAEAEAEARPVGLAGWPEKERRLDLQRDATVYLEGDLANHWYEVASGVVSEANLSLDGRRQIVAFHFPGELFGLNDPEGRHRLTAVAAALGASVVIPHRRAQLEAMAATDPRIALWQRDVMRDDLKRVQAQLLLIGQAQAAERVAVLLEEFSVRLARCAAQNGDDHVTQPLDAFELPVTSRDIACYLGLTLETVSRSLRVLSQKGIIALPACRMVRILDRAQLGQAGGKFKPSSPTRIAVN